MQPSLVFKAAFSRGALFSGSFAGWSGDVAPVLLDSVRLSFFCFFMSGWWWDQISVCSTGCCQTPSANKHLTGLLLLMEKSMFGIANWYYLLTHYTTKDRNNWLKTIFVGENTNSLRLLHSSVCEYSLKIIFVPLKKIKGVLKDI